MLIDCASCIARDIACGECVVRVLLDGPALARPTPVDLDSEEQAAIGMLAEAGLVPPLRLVRPIAGPEIDPDFGADFDPDFGADGGPGGISPGSARPASRGIA